MKKRQILGHLLSVIAFCLLMVLAAGSSSDEDSKVTKVETPKTAEELRREVVEKYFSAWDGSHIGLTKVIKESMNDPKSYEHVETRYGDKGDYLLVSATFRGKNAFGGVVKNTVVAKVDLDGNVIEILSQE